ncbi:hypothetical protein GGI21_005795 [Coemansia aciculifera]|uniref:Uncharacterized protein n=1 Tax=Coemansia aciculifera TaxID=417176 RepID=A0ACC1M8I5_9FUNG|nr:hypothetical protein GGI21_005795 [Coemansia aciculifera]KAJ2900138.1 hypothetical protein IWW38_000678 [Coemansia aciculifera]
MSDTTTLQALSTLLKRKPSKRERKERARQNIGAFIRRSSTGASGPAPAATAKPATVVDSGRVTKTEVETSRREKNASALRAADKLVSDRSKKLHSDILELMRAQQEHRNPKLKRKTKLTYFDFEDEN